jgi:hypothetical protein
LFVTDNDEDAGNSNPCAKKNFKMIQPEYNDPSTSDDSDEEEEEKKQE